MDPANVPRDNPLTFCGILLELHKMMLSHKKDVILGICYLNDFQNVPHKH